MESAVPNPVGFQEAIERLVTRITWTDHIIVEIAETDENNIRLNTVADVFEVPLETVEQAVIRQAEADFAKPNPNQELDDLLIAEQQRGFQDTGD